MPDEHNQCLTQTLAPVGERIAGDAAVAVAKDDRNDVHRDKGDEGTHEQRCQSYRAAVQKKDRLNYIYPPEIEGLAE